MAIVMTGSELGLLPMQSLRSIDMVKGKPTLKAEAQVALVRRRSDVCKYFRMVESTDAVATYETLRAGDPEPTRMSFSMAQATAAGLAGGDNWRKYSAAMLRARCSAALCRTVYSDLVLGLYDPEELEVHSETATAPVATKKDAIEGVFERKEALTVASAPSAVVSEVAADGAAPYAAESPVAEIVAAIEACNSQTELKSVAARISGLSDSDKASVRGPYGVKSAALRGGK